MLVLASGSPRRAELLRQVGLKFRVVVSRAPELLSKKETPDGYVRRLSLAKAAEVRERLRGRGLRKGAVIGADTVVVFGRHILEKPANAAQARRMLARLSGREHRVLTGVAVLPLGTGKPKHFVETTRVRFRRLSAREISAYVDTGEPMDKAGAYGIQGRAAVFVTGIRGCYFNVVGLPLARLLRAL